MMGFYQQGLSIPGVGQNVQGERGWQPGVIHDDDVIALVFGCDGDDDMVEFFGCSSHRQDGGPALLVGEVLGQLPWRESYGLAGYAWDGCERLLHGGQ
jgi:hypothetical protein